MFDFTIKLITTLIDKKDITWLFCSHDEETVSKLLKIEPTEFLNYDTYDRIIKTECSELNAYAHRDCNGGFSDQTIAPYKRRNDTLESTITNFKPPDWPPLKSLNSSRKCVVNIILKRRFPISYRRWLKILCHLIKKG